MDMFGRQDQVLMGALSSDSMFLSWPELAAVGGGLGMLIQQIQMQYQQPIRRIFEIGPGVVPVGNGFASAQYCFGPNADAGCLFRSQPTYYIVGRPEGMITFGKFVGPTPLGSCFYRQYGSPCGPNVIHLSGTAGCSANGPKTTMTWSMHGLVLNQYSGGLSGQEMVMQENIGAMYAGLSIAVSPDAGC